ncbi:hypothetical protein BHUM_04067c [Candidatus Burkholderia humilis]|nr:hypothetical protein BHUM_04067c [Candidatus Burkholderia humilis]
MQEDSYKRSIDYLESIVHILASRLSPPEMRSVNGVSIGFRYRENGARQAIVQKIARIVSSLRAARLLLNGGFVQEQAALHRMLDETQEDVNFLAGGVILGETGLHQKFLCDFFLEEYGDPKKPAETLNKRGNIPRSKIHAYLNNINTSEKFDPSTGNANIEEYYLRDLQPKRSMMKNFSRMS